MLKIGIIGSGFGVYGLLPAFGSTKNCQVVGICAKKTDRLLDYCKKYKVKKIYGNWREILKQEDLDAIAIAVVPSVQYQIAKEAIRKGLHVFAEKPLAANYEQAQQLFRLARKHKTVTAVDFIFPEIPEWKKAKELLEKKYFGKLLYLKADWDFLSYDLKHQLKSWKTDVKQGGGALAFFFSHVLYYLEYFAGEIKVANSRLINSSLSLNGGEVGVDLLFKSKSGTEGSAHLNCAAQGFKNHRLVFICERGVMVLENNKDVSKNFGLKIFKNGKLEGRRVKKNVLKKLDERVTVVRNNADKFIKGCMRNKQVSPSFKEGLRVQKLIDEVRKFKN